MLLWSFNGIMNITQWNRNLEIVVTRKFIHHIIAVKIYLVVLSYNSACDWWRMHVLQKCCHKQIYFRDMKSTNPDPPDTFNAGVVSVGIARRLDTIGIISSNQISTTRSCQCTTILWVNIKECDKVIHLADAGNIYCVL